ncbi:MAG: hypothetical protein IPK50_15895 [Fibrobacterota bacterium]|nr:hypothetical protein [Fibrobacterota bacterium]QQS03772.1 MAG: hypothetical protein IPK50_15895 [Fibrobacterota bacterium]
MPIIHRTGSRPVMKFAAILACFSAQGMAAKTEVPVFLFSGQSNMVGLGTSTNDLTADQKKTYADIKIYLDAEGDAAKMKKWSTLGPGFGGSSSQFGPELFFGKVLADSFPGRKMAFIKVARSGTYLGKVAEWLPPSSNNGTGGTYYKAMMVSIDDAMKSFNSAFDTTQYTPKWSGFLWLQGEFDAMDATLSNQYETNLTNLLKDIRTKAGVTDLPVILPMIDVQSTWTNNAKIRAADIALTKKLTRVDTVDTKGLPTDNIHYKAAGMITIGTRCAARFLTMKSLSAIDLAYRPQPTFSASDAPRFDLVGRRIGGQNVAHGVSGFLTIEGGKIKLSHSAPVR